VIEADGLHTSFRDLATIFFRRLRPMAAIFLLTAGGAIAWQFLLHDDVYEVTAKLLVRVGAEKAATQVTMTGQRDQVVGFRQQDVNSEVDILKSLDVVGRVVDKLRLDRRAPTPVPEGLWRRIRYETKRFVSGIREWVDEIMIGAGFRPRLTDREKAIAALDSGLSVSSQGESNIIVVRLKMPGRENVAAVLNGLVALYLESRYGLFEDTGAAKVFEKQTDEVRERLKSADLKMQRLELGASLAAIAARKEILLRRAAETQASLINDLLLLSESREKLERLREQLKSTNPNIGVVGSFNASTVEESLVKQMTELRKEEAKFDSSARVVNLRRQFRALAAILQSNLEATVRERTGATESRSKELARIKDELATIQAREAEWVTLKREIRILEQRYEFYQKKYEDVAAAGTLERARIGNVVVVQRAQDPLRPIGVSRFAFVLIAGTLAALAALSWCAVAEFLDHGVRTVEEVERRLGAPALAVPHLAREAAGPAALPKAAFRKAALALYRALGDEKAGTVAFIGTNAGAGCTTAALQIARNMRAVYDCKVVVVELDDRDASLCDRLALDPERTLQAYARGERALADCLQDGPNGVKVLASAPTDQSRRRDPEFAQLARLVPDLERSFAHIFLDMPPVPQPEFIAVGQVVSRAVIVVESGRARYEMLQRIRTELAHEGIAMIGAVLNKQRRYIPSWIYRAIFE